MNSRAVCRFALFLAIWAGGSGEARTEDSVSKATRVVGSWKVRVDWGKGDKAEEYIITVTPDLTGTITNLPKDWTVKLRQLQVRRDAVVFRFFYDDDEKLDVQFEGRVAGDRLQGTFNVLGTSRTVTGTRLDAAEAPAVAARPSVFDVYEARRFTSSDGETLVYRLFVPPAYEPQKKYPLVLFHHGGGGTGTDNRRQLEGACVREWVREEFQRKHPCFIVAPQIPGKDPKSSGDIRTAIPIMRRRIRAVHQLLDALEKEFSIDTDREYITGFSFGGECTWLSLIERPERFAAAVPICAGEHLIDLPVAERGRRLARMPLWIFHGAADRVIPVDVSRRVVQALADAGGNPKYTEYRGTATTAGTAPIGIRN